MHLLILSTLLFLPGIKSSNDLQTFDELNTEIVPIQEPQHEKILSHQDNLKSSSELKPYEKHIVKKFGNKEASELERKLAFLLSQNNDGENEISSNESEKFIQKYTPKYSDEISEQKIKNKKYDKDQHSMKHKQKQNEHKKYGNKDDHDRFKLMKYTSHEDKDAHFMKNNNHEHSNYMKDKNQERYFEGHLNQIKNYNGETPHGKELNYMKDKHLERNFEGQNLNYVKNKNHDLESKVRGSEVRRFDFGNYRSDNQRINDRFLNFDRKHYKEEKKHSGVKAIGYDQQNRNGKGYKENGMENKDGRYGNSMEHKENRYDNSMEHKENRYRNSMEHKESRYDNSKKQKENSMERKENRYDNSMEHKENRYEKFDSIESGEKDNKFPKKYESDFNDGNSEGDFIKPGKKGMYKKDKYYYEKNKNFHKNTLPADEHNAFKHERKERVKREIDSSDSDYSFHGGESEETTEKVIEEHNTDIDNDMMIIQDKSVEKPPVEEEVIKKANAYISCDGETGMCHRVKNKEVDAEQAKEKVENDETWLKLLEDSIKQDGIDVEYH